MAKVATFMAGAALLSLPVTAVWAQPAAQRQPAAGSTASPGAVTATTGTVGGAAVASGVSTTVIAALVGVSAVVTGIVAAGNTSKKDVRPTSP